MITTIQIPSTCFKSSSSTLTQKQRPNLFVENGEIIVFHPYRSIMMMKLQTNHIQFSNFFSNKQTESKKNCKIEILKKKTQKVNEFWSLFFVVVETMQ